MSMTMESSRHKITFGYGGFLRCRMRIACLVSPEVGQHYEGLRNCFNIPIEQRKAFFATYNKKTDKLIENGKLSEELAEFLYAPDCGAELDPKTVQAVLDVINNGKDTGENERYGSVVWSDAATWESFKNLLWDCVFDGTKLTWY